MLYKKKNLFQVFGAFLLLSLNNQAMACELVEGYELPKQANWGELCRFSEGLAPIEQKGQYGFIDNYGQIVITPSYDFAAPFSEGLANVEKQGKWGYIDKQGKVVIPIVYDDARWFSEGLAAVNINDNWGFINRQNKLQVPAIFEETEGFSEGLAPVKKNDNWGFIDSYGNMQILPQYQIADIFIEGLALVAKDNKYGYINKLNRTIIPFEYDFPLLRFNNGFNNDIATLMKDNKAVEVNKQGEVVSLNGFMTD